LRLRPRSRRRLWIRGSKPYLEIDASYRADRMHDQGKVKSVRPGDHLTPD